MSRRPLLAPVTELAAEFARVSGELRRLLHRQVRQRWPLPPLPPPQVELLRVVQRQPGIRVNEAAVELRVAANTVSTLVGRLAAQGLLKRRVDPTDARATQLVLTVTARRRLAAWQDHRAQLLGEGLQRLSEEERALLARTVPVWRHVVELLATDEEVRR